MTVCVALLRGINVGGNKMVSMSRLRAICERLGFGGVRTLLQSGNVVFDAGKAKPAAVVKRLEPAIAQAFGFDVAVIVRTAAEFSAAVSRNPFAEVVKTDPGQVLVTFLAAAPESPRGLDGYEGPEKAVVSGREVFIHYVGGVGRSKLGNTVIEKRLGATGTARNWNTVSKLAELVTRP